MQKLPKSLNDHPRLARLEAYFSTALAPLYPDARVQVAHVPLDPALKEALAIAFGTRHLLQGLELITTALDREEKGLAAARAKAGAPRPQRVSRLLILASDGTTRFYRDAASLITRHEDRLATLRVDATGDELGRAFTAKGGAAKALLVDDKDALGLALSRLAELLP